MSGSRHKHGAIGGTMQSICTMDSFISEVHPITNGNLFSVNLGDNPSSRRVVEFVGMTNTDAHLRCLTHNRLCNGMLGLGFGNRCGFEYKCLAYAVRWSNLHDLG